MPRATPHNTKRPVPYQPAGDLEPLTIWSQIKQELEEAENPKPHPPQRFYPPPR